MTTVRPSAVPPAPTEGAIAALRAEVGGTVLSARDQGCAEAVSGWNTAVRHRPAVVVLPESVGDVVAAVRWAAGLGLPVAVHSTGHGPTAAADGGLVVVTSRLRAVEVDPRQRTVTVQAGSTWGEVLAATAEHGLVPALASSPGVGAVGSTLGSAIGWFARRFGTGADDVRRVDVVLPDGSLARTTADHEPEVFRALRGAGAGTFGVVVALQLAVHEVPTVYAGALWYPGDQAAEVLRQWRDWSDGTPDELTSFVTMVDHGRAGWVPEDKRDGAWAVIRGCWSGETAAGVELVDRLRAWREPVLDQWTERPVGDLVALGADPPGPMHLVGACALFDTLSDEAVDELVGGWGTGPNGELRVVLTEVRRLGGAVRTRGTDAVDDVLRGSEFVACHRTPVRNAAHERRTRIHLDRVRTALKPHTNGGMFVNFADAADRVERAQSAFGPANWDRLRALKTILDPDNRFRYGVTVPPLAPAAPRRADSAQDGQHPDATEPARRAAVDLPRPTRPTDDEPAVRTPQEALADDYVSPGFVVPPVVVHPALERAGEGGPVAEREQAQA